MEQPHTATELLQLVNAAERTEILRALEEHSHNRTVAARALGISRRTLCLKIRKHRLPEKPRSDMRLRQLA